MNRRSIGVGGALIATVWIGLTALPEADARGERGGRGGRGARAPHAAVHNRSVQRMPKMPRAASPARSNMRANNGQFQNNRNNNLASARQAQSGVLNQAGFGSGTSMNSLTYGTGRNARNYQAYGYGRGYRNRSYGRRSGYGRSQSNNRAVVARLRSVHASLARIDHTYQGHRARAMHSVSMAIRQLSHRSMVYRNSGFAAGMNQNGLAMGQRRGNGNLNGAGRRRQPLTQAQSDARMSQALRTTQGIQMQLGSQGSYTSGHARARGHVQRAVHEMSAALAVR